MGNKATSIYCVKTEINDQGWYAEDSYFKTNEGAKEYLIKLAASRIWAMYRQGYEISHMIKWGRKGDILSVTFNAWDKEKCKYYYYEMRIFDVPLYD